MNQKLTLWPGIAGVALGAALLAAGGPSPVLAGDTPATIGAGVDTQAEAIEANRTPAISVEELIPMDGGRILRFLEPASEDDRGSYYSDGGLDPAGPPNALERAKLEMARAAVEASRLAGTLYAPAPEEIGPNFTEDEIHAIKQQRLSAMTPAQIESDTVAGVGEGLPSIQETGPQVLTPGEAEKAAAGTTVVDETGVEDPTAGEERK